MRASAVAASTTAPRHALSTALGPTPARLLAGADTPKWSVRETSALRVPARRQQVARGCCGPLTTAASFAAARRDSAFVPSRSARFASTLAEEERERDFDPTFVNDVFSGFNGHKTEDIPLPQHVRKSLSNPAAVTFPRVDQFDRFLDYTAYDDEAQGYPDLGVSFPRVRVPGKHNIRTTAESVVDLLRETSGVSSNYYRNLYKRVTDVRYRKIYARGTKLRTMRATTIVGDGKGSAGLGIGEATDVRTALRLAYVNAYRQMESFYIYDNRTLHSGGEFKYQGFRLSVKAKRPGFGKRVHHTFYDLCEAVGIKDVGGKTRGTHNPPKVVNTFFAFLRTQRRPHDVARARGLKMTDLMHIYYGRPQES